MNILQRTFNGITKSLKTQAANVLFQSLYWMRGYDQPITYDENYTSYVENGYGKNATVYSIVSYLSEKAAGVKFKVVTENADGELQRAEGDGANKLRELIKKPNAWQGQREFMEQAFGFYFVTGNAYVYGPRLEGGLNKGQTKEMFVAPSQYMEIISGGWMQPIKAWRLIYGNYSKQMKAEDVLHFRKANLDFEQGSEWYGQSPLKAGNLVLSKSNSGYEAQTALYQNRGAGGLVSSDGQTQLTPEQAEQLRNTYKQKYAGPSATGEPMFTGANVKWQKMVMSSQELGLNEDSVWSIRDLCNIWHVPSQLFGDPDNQTYSNLKEARKAVWTDAIIPALDGFINEFNRWIVESYGEGLMVVPDYSEIPELQADLLETAQIMNIASANGAITKNEFREALGFERVENPLMDEFTESFGRVPVGYSDAQIEEAAEKALTKLGIKDF